MANVKIKGGPKAKALEEIKAWAKGGMAEELKKRHRGAPGHPSGTPDIEAQDTPEHEALEPHQMEMDEEALAGRHPDAKESAPMPQHPGKGPHPMAQAEPTDSIHVLTTMQPEKILELLKKPKK